MTTGDLMKKLKPQTAYNYKDGGIGQRLNEACINQMGGRIWNDLWFFSLVHIWNHLKELEDRFEEKLWKKMK